VPRSIQSFFKFKLPRIRPRNLCDKILRFLRDHPDDWYSAKEIAEAMGMETMMRRVYECLASFEVNDLVEIREGRPRRYLAKSNARK